VAQRVVTQFVDDLDGTELTKRSGQTVSFGLDGKSYEVDLSNRNAKQFRDLLQPYVKAGRRVARRRRGHGGRSGGTHRDPAQTQNIREWAGARSRPLGE
jgi:Lsr2